MWLHFLQGTYIHVKFMAAHSLKDTLNIMLQIFNSFFSKMC